MYLQDIHTSLRKSAGLINFVKDTLIPQLIEKPVSGSDLDIRVVAAYLNQCTAEAQEGKIMLLIGVKEIAILPLYLIIHSIFAIITITWFQ